MLTFSCRRTISFLTLLTVSTLTLSWGPTGHRVIGRIAEHHVSDSAKRYVTSILGSESLAQVSTWADEIRSDPAWNAAMPWHFVSIDDGETYQTTAKNPAGDVIEAIERCIKILGDPLALKNRKAEALKFLVHFVGDLHQPFHVGRRSDFGGNTIKVTWFGEPTNLHAVWDDKIIDVQKLSFSEFADFIDHPTPTEITLWQNAPITQWAEESQNTRESVYAIGDGKLAYGYAYQNGPLLKRRLLQAGIRLAGILNALSENSANTCYHPDEEIMECASDQCTR